MLSVLSGLDPYSRRSLTAFKEPRSAAQCKLVLPLESGIFVKSLATDALPKDSSVCLSTVMALADAASWESNELPPTRCALVKEENEYLGEPAPELNDEALLSNDEVCKVFAMA